MMLLPCPFCGGESHRFECEETDNKGGSVIGCKQCQASTRVFFGRREGLVEAWNTRPHPPADSIEKAIRELELRNIIFDKGDDGLWKCTFRASPGLWLSGTGPTLLSALRAAMERIEQ